MDIKFKKLNEKARKPGTATYGSAGYDLFATEDHVIHSGDTADIGTGVSFEIPPLLVGLICPKSGLAFKHKLTVLNGPGVIDPDYRGEVRVMLINEGREGDHPYLVKEGDKVAQIVFVPCIPTTLVEATDFTKTDRVGGFGSTGR